MPDPTFIGTILHRTLDLKKPTLGRVSPGPVGEQQADKVKQAIQKHAAALQTFSVTDLSRLGTLPISGNVIPRIGLLKPQTLNPRIPDLYERSTLFSGAVRIKPGSAGSVRPLAKFGGQAYILKSEPFPQQIIQPRVWARGRSNQPIILATPQIPIPTAYWAANEIIIADGTMIILQPPHSYLVIIANKITIGTNVIFTWAQVSKEIPSQPAKLGKLPPPPTSIYMSGTSGQNGSYGGHGGRGPDGDRGPEIEIWTSDINRIPSEVLINGQHGFPGGKGQEGQDGQDGARGRGFVKGRIPGTCKSGPGNGGRGGIGGRGGDGGPGGDGGHGGRFNLYAPLPILGNVGSQGFYIDTKEGDGGPGGAGGAGGQGGAGGRAGNDRDGIGCPTDFGKHGASGQSGSAGNQGASGHNGDHFLDSDKFLPIDNDELIRAFNKPVILGLSAENAHFDEVLSAYGQRFTNTDAVFIDDVPATTTFVSDTLITFIVPSMKGGRQKAVYVKQQDGTTSNRATLHILPSISWVEQDGHKSPPDRLTPGKKVYIIGGGFSDRLDIKLNDQFVNRSDINYEGPSKISFMIFRPGNVVPNPAGENVDIKVILDDGAASESFQAILDTIVIVVLGDSIQWGQGLREDLKFHSAVAAHMSNDGIIGVYKTVHAHSGATIGYGDNNQEPPVNGEVPTSYPTILQQADLYIGDANLVDIALIDGGINDIGVDEIVNPIATSDLGSLAQTHCYADMKYLLKKVSNKFPHAKIVVTGYYQIVSGDSNLDALILLLSGLGMLVGGLATAIAAGAVSVEQKGVMASRCKRFAEEANKYLKQAVADTITENSASGRNNQLLFAEPNFGAANSIFASDSWLWGIEMDLGPADDPQYGGVEGARSEACNSVDSQYPGRTSMTRCIRASMGHPNVKGAKEYARVITALL